MLNFKVLPYKQGSCSASTLSRALGCKVLSLRNSRIHRMRTKLIINWGNSGLRLPPDGLGRQHRILNATYAVNNAANKLRTLQILSRVGVSVPEFTVSGATAQEWLDSEKTVVERHCLTGNSGDGVRIVSSGGTLLDAPLYTKYIKKNQEFRVHIVSGVVTDVQRKARRASVPDDQINWQVRNLAGGFVFVREGVNPHQDVLNQATRAVQALSLDFGAVDVIWNEHEQRAYVLEVNTAAGLEGTTLEKYVSAFNRIRSGMAVDIWSPAQQEELLEESVVQHNTYSF